MQGQGYTDLNPSEAIIGLVAYPEIHQKYIPGQLFFIAYINILLCIYNCHRQR